MLPLELKFAAIAAAVAACLFGAIKLRADMKAADIAGCVAQTAQAAASASEAQRVRDQAVMASQAKAISDAHEQTMQVAAAAGRALDAATRLRQRAAVVAASCASPDPAALAGSAAAYSSGDLLADVLGRTAGAAQQLAAAADAARIAGNACTREYNALKGTP